MRFLSSCQYTYGCCAPASLAARHTTVCLDSSQRCAFTGNLTLLAILYGMRSARAYTCACLLAVYSTLMVGLGGSGCGKKPGQAAVQVNVVRRDGTIGLPLFYSTPITVISQDWPDSMAHEATT